MTPREKRLIRILSGVLFFLYLAALLYFLFFSDEYGRSSGAEMRYNLIPFTEIGRFLRYRKKLGARSVFLNIFGNVLGFVPLGLFLPVLHRRFRTLRAVAAASAGFSCLVELTQLLTRRGSCDIDDVILNTLGGMLGYLLFFLCDKWRRNRSGREAAGG